MPDNEETIEETPGTSEAMSWDDIQLLAVAEVDAAKKYVEQNRSIDRTARWDRYYGRPLGNEMKGRSKYISRDVMDTIEWVMPYFIRQFTSTDPKIDITIEGQEPYVGKALMSKIQTDLSSTEDTSMFLLFYQWFKDSLVSDTAFVKPHWELDHEIKVMTWPQLPAEQMKQLMDDPDVEVVSFDEGASPLGGVFTNVKTRIKSVKKSGLAASNIPFWEFICGKDATHINDEHGKGHVTPVTLDYLNRINRGRGGEYFKHLNDIFEDAEQPRTLSVDPLDHGQAEKEAYTQESTIPYGDTAPKKGAAGEIKLTEWFSRMDTEGTGYLQDVVVWLANDTMIRWEDNTEGMIAMCALSPIIDCYKLFGTALADLLTDIQNLKTMIVRRILDNFDFTNLGVWLTSDSSIDVNKLMTHVPGDVIRITQKGSTEKVSAEPFDSSVLNLLEWVDTAKENRTGVSSRQGSFGTTPEHKTLGGMKMLQNAMMGRLELIARIFAETGIKDFYMKCTKLYQIYMRKPFKAKVKGQWVGISREQIQGRVVCTVNMGIEAEVGMFEAQKIERIAEFLTNLNQQFPGILGLQQVHNMADRHTLSMGFKQTDDFVPGLKQFAKILKQARDNQGAAAQAEGEAAQMEAQIKQGELQLKGAELQLKESEIKLKVEELRMKSAVEHGKLETEDRKLTAETMLTEADINLKRTLAAIDTKLKLIGIQRDREPQVNL